MRNNKNVLRFTIGFGSIDDLEKIIFDIEQPSKTPIIFLIDHFFESQSLKSKLPIRDDDIVHYVDTSHEPTTWGIDNIHNKISLLGARNTSIVIGIGGGSTLDTAKAISNLLTNGGKAEEFQGWDLVRMPGTYKIGIPTLSGTGAESSRTCVMTNTANQLKLGMNSDYSIYDQLILDPDLTKTVPKDQYFYTGVDTFIHCIESLEGKYRNVIGDSFAREAFRLSKEVFLNSDMMDDESREKLMVASYLGGCAIAHSFVGLVHPFSAGLSVVLGLPHGLSNCIALNAMEEFYPDAVAVFHEMVDVQGIQIPREVCSHLSERQLNQIYQASIIHEKPLSNALGKDFKTILTKDKVLEIFNRM